jgi:hypothetical protein
MKPLVMRNCPGTIYSLKSLAHELFADPTTCLEFTVQSPFLLLQEQARLFERCVELREMQLIQFLDCGHFLARGLLDHYLASLRDQARAATLDPMARLPYF